MGLHSNRPIILYEDNNTAILFSNHPGDHKRSNYVDTKKYFLHDAVINSEIRLEYVNTADQLADGLT
jgi:hypothetical protein